MSHESRKKSEPPAGGAASDAPARTPQQPRKRTHLRFEAPEVLHTALEEYARDAGLTKGGAARNLLMRLLVQRVITVPEPLDEAPRDRPYGQ